MAKQLNRQVKNAEALYEKSVLKEGEALEFVKKYTDYKERRCLSCNSLFMSEGKWNRRCTYCHQLELNNPDRMNTPTGTIASLSRHFRFE